MLIGDNRTPGGKWLDYPTIIVVISILQNPLQDAEIQHVIDPSYHIFQLDDSGPQVEDMGNEEESLSAATQWLLPSRDLNGLWDSLIFDSSVKDELLNFATSALLFSDCGVKEHIIGLNRVVLLHGPPGTGKTSLCRALAQKLAIRLSSRFKCGQLIEINSHSLFSKWFSESGKLVMRMFEHIRNTIAESEAIVCVLIDEVESLAHARSNAQGGTEPSDSMRAVNALLTQIDAIRRYPNVIILTTSNITGAIDLAFVDRADIKKYIGLPTGKALYKIYFDCLAELMRTNIIYPRVSLLRTRQAHKMTPEIMQAYPESSILLELSKFGVISPVKYVGNWKSEGLSGRCARKIPFLAHANHLQRPQSTLNEFLEAMRRTIKQEFLDRSLIQSNSTASTTA
ncbi:hypothetical protein B566_EDAN006536 [Ephemera danica]|nr:hypothetical protein B566_EDAN006536 [Ephemera danica]